MSRTNDWNDWYLFSCVAQLGSFSRTAERLQLPKSTVSTALARLEQKLGLRLLERSTRRLRLTEAGFQLLADVGPLFARLEDVADHLQGHAEAPLSGTLRIASPYEFASLHLSPVLCDIMQAHPALHIEVDVVSSLIDPLSSGYDLSFVMTSQALPDSSQLGKRLYTLQQGLFAAPALLARHGQPQHPSALADWPLLGAASALPWVFQHTDGQHFQLQQPLLLQTANAGLRLQAAIAGRGACLVSGNFAAAAVANGQLVQLLPAWTLPPLKTYALIPNRSLLPTKTRLLLEGLEQRFATLEQR
ncbi:transcriptional regulator [Aquitalea magnusonii]|jgi:DNA-binding transcriptional LysR family regulator|uniref:Transcriptional regulator n=1 Tax=Aquitalea magnusonii TaxID=332411 RepID=A0A3G9GMH0_9NEIS|nr:LysR family transcriptional regulator [Aquitalea magnusonii]BBF86416.1 transcriptional regulator [Aquitalea magnusonii]